MYEFLSICTSTVKNERTNGPISFQKRNQNVLVLFPNLSCWEQIVSIWSRICSPGQSRNKLFRWGRGTAVGATHQGRNYPLQMNFHKQLLWFSLLVLFFCWHTQRFAMSTVEPKPRSPIMMYCMVECKWYIPAARVPVACRWACSCHCSLYGMHLAASIIYYASRPSSPAKLGKTAINVDPLAFKQQGKVFWTFLRRGL